MGEDTKKKNSAGSRGFSLLFAVLTGSLVLAIGIAMAGIASKELTLSSIGRESQFAFYAADTGSECALYWDLKNSSGISAFSTTTAGSINCMYTSIQTGSQNIAGVGMSLVGGGGNGSPTSVFQVDFNTGSDPKPYCARVWVKKEYYLDNGKLKPKTTIESRGYNTCGASATKVERAIRVTLNDV
jgi:hypothetical protein